MKNTSANLESPIVASVQFPLAMPSSRAAVEAAIEKAESAIFDARNQLICLDLADFFAAHPRVVKASFSGDWEGDDEGGSNFYASAEIALRKLAAGEESAYDEDDEAMGEELGEELVGILAGHVEDLDGTTLSWKPGEGVATLGKKIMGASAHAAWMAGRERVELDRVANEPSEESLEAMRL